MHSVDSPALLDAIEARGAPQRCLIQVNVAGEASKKGVAPAELPALLDRFAAMAHVRCEGLMLIPPRGDARPHFAALRALRDREAARARPNVDLRELSMGMTDDLEVAVAEGATIVRVGTAIFGPRPTPRWRSGYGNRPLATSRSRRAWRDRSSACAAAVSASRALRAASITSRFVVAPAL